MGLHFDAVPIGGDVCTCDINDVSRVHRPWCGMMPRADVDELRQAEAFLSKYAIEQEIVSPDHGILLESISEVLHQVRVDLQRAPRADGGGR